MTITLTPEIEQAIDEAARKQDTTPEELVLKTLETRFAAPAQNIPQRMPGPTAAELASMPLKERVRAAMSSMAHLGPSRLLEERPEEIAREERRWLR